MGTTNMATYQFSNSELETLKVILTQAASNSYQYRAMAEGKIQLINAILAARNSRG